MTTTILKTSSRARIKFWKANLREEYFLSSGSSCFSSQWSDDIKAAAWSDLYSTFKRKKNILHQKRVCSTRRTTIMTMTTAMMMMIKCTLWMMNKPRKLSFVPNRTHLTRHVGQCRWEWLRRWHAIHIPVQWLMWTFFITWKRRDLPVIDKFVHANTKPFPGVGFYVFDTCRDFPYPSFPTKPWTCIVHKNPHPLTYTLLRIAWSSQPSLQCQQLFPI